MAENEVECSTFSRFHLHDLFVVKDQTKYSLFDAMNEELCSLVDEDYNSHLLFNECLPS